MDCLLELVFPLSISHHDFPTYPLNFSAVDRRRSGQSLETVKKPFLSNMREYGMEKKFHFIFCSAW
jgi:hypothetical protein